MRHAIRKHLRDFIAILGMIVLAGGIAAYILSHQRLRFPIIEEKPFVLEAQFSNARGVMPGQGQTVRVAGMRIGDIGKVELENGYAMVKMQLDREHEELVHKDATALLRPRTGLKDMFIELDPGSEKAPVMKEGEVIPVKNTAPDVNADEVLEALDTDTRAYLRLLITGAGKGLQNRGGDLREVFRRLGPLFRDITRLNKMVAERRRNLARLIHNSGETFEELSKKDQELTTFVTSNRRVFEALASEDQNISRAVSKLPSTLGQAEQTLNTVNELGRTMGPAFESLRPAVRKLDDANREVLPFAREAAPILQNQIRPFVRAARPYLDELRPAARNLAEAQPDLRESFFELNRFFNMGAYNPKGAEKLTGNLARDRDRQEGLLFWLGWLTQNGSSLFSTSDAGGPFRRFIVSATCSTFSQLRAEEPLSTLVFNVANLLADANACPTS